MHTSFIALGITLISLMAPSYSGAVTTPTLSAPPNLETNSLQDPKTKLYEALNAGPLTAGNFDPKIEISIAQTQLELAKEYMQQGDRRLALILGILARKTMQRALGNPQDPEMIPIYSILVELYTYKVDKDAPGTDQSDAAKAKEYREAIDRIHAQ